MLRADLDHCEWLPDDLKSGEMVFIPGGTFRMGSDHHYPEEAPSHRVSVDGFWIDRTPVTNRQFKQFVNATGHVTEAQIVPNAKDYPGAVKEMLYAGSLVFSPLPRITDLTDWSQRGGLEAEEFAWGDALMPGGKHMANIWQGNFPVQNHGEDGYERTSPVMAFPPNGYGLYDMIGNVWEWTSDWWSSRHAAEAAKPCCIPRNPRGGHEDASYDPRLPDIKIPRKVLKGGSHLCAPNYCRRYRPAARHAEPVDTSTSHVGFRCVARLPLVIHHEPEGSSAT
ncbi:formylglycine-generating enzyme family protein [Bradyrhizobium sp. KB893862 SZCCT0404]|uniref:SUMF1/EgtB/PvdO family nonheme iron enzyme n=1 Tax=Bradyrhizobium sp. KB893862 SZCCT0404 TaxID=2807672 RepID=UPI001BA63203|nr:SUMF1/EgtB/PvdO family nonheme iron enzyme [Bradyrhizobium sp. KB893862 SZCCT0404]MBR1173993.1 formylglycine-generating enzyme family protein [Bradyrhizobium sp. KB893862 SZCCT0404]